MCEFYVLGTSHDAQSRSKADVRDVVRRVRPRCVVLELDRARAEALWEGKRRRAARGCGDDDARGDDLLTGLVEAARAGADVVCGDVRVDGGLVETVRSRAVAHEDGTRGAARWRRAARYARRAATGDDAAAAAEDGDGDGRVVACFVNALEAAARDGGVRWSRWSRSALVAGAAVAVGSSAVSSAGAFDAVSVGMFLFAFCPLVETVWMDRDDALVRHATNAARACAAVADGDARRVSFRFSADPLVTADRVRAFTPRDANARPCFTLKRALARGETRRLNLWEPRWLALLDALADANGGRLVGAELGCLLGHTRHYYGDDDDDPSRRAASVVVDNAFARARVVRVVEGERPRTKARKVEVWIERVDEDDEIVRDVEAHAAGYLLASVVPANEETVAPERVVVDDDESSVACVVVAGLTHVNGVVAGLASV